MKISDKIANEMLILYITA